jgi:curved DNA-binding protein CbpA
MENLYEILGVQETSSLPEIKTAYFKLAKKHHPDASDRAEIKKFYEATEAYRVLSDPEQRRAYDQTLKGGKIEKILVEEPVHPTIFKEAGVADEEFRKKEMYSFKRKIYFKAILRIIGFGLALAAIACVFSYILNGNRFIGLLAGLIIGVIWSISSNFDVDSFIQSERNKKITKIISRSAMGLSIAYFIWLLIRRLI